MALLQDAVTEAQLQIDLIPARVSDDAERAARRSLRAQIARLERELSDAFVTAFPMGGLEYYEAPAGQPRILNLGELERARDELAERLRAARIQVAECADVFEANRVLLERMLLEPARHRYRRVALRDIGEPGCGAWEVRPRLGLIGMLAGWWHVKLSSGCPLAGGRGAAPRPSPAEMHERLRTGRAALLVVLIMFIGSLVLWLGTPLLWLWIGSQIEGSTSSLGAALSVMFIGVVTTIAALAMLLSRLSNVYRRTCVERGLDDPGHVMLEGVLVVSATISLTGFAIWFFLFAGASPVPIGIQL